MQGQSRACTAQYMDGRRFENKKKTDGTEEQLYGPSPLLASAKAGSAPYLEDIVFFPEFSGDVTLRYRWLKHRRRRPIVPAPMNTPVSDKQSTPDAKARLFLVYKRP